MVMTAARRGVGWAKKIYSTSGERQFTPGILAQKAEPEPFFPLWNRTCKLVPCGMHLLFLPLAVASGIGPNKWSLAGVNQGEPRLTHLPDVPGF